MKTGHILKVLVTGTVAALLLFLPPGGPVQAAPVNWDFEIFLGSAYNIPTPLLITQKGEEDIKIDRAQYATRALEESPYYAYRFTRWNGEKGWGLELIHHKLHLLNKHDAIDHFEISHGYNLIVINRSWTCGKNLYYLGGGIVLTHPETVIRGKQLSWLDGSGLFGKGFYLSGPAVQLAVNRTFPLWGKLFLTVEAKATAAYAYATPVQDGNASVPNLALHGLIGLGYRF